VIVPQPRVLDSLRNTRVLTRVMPARLTTEVALKLENPEVYHYFGGFDEIFDVSSRPYLYQDRQQNEDPSIRNLHSSGRYKVHYLKGNA
jgi:hypothetical protein